MINTNLGFFTGLNFRRWPWSKDDYKFNNQNIILDTVSPVLFVNKDDLLTPVLDCPHLQLVITKACDMFSNGQWKCVSTKDRNEEYPDDEILKLLNKPNILQSGEDFNWQYLFYKLTFANNFIYAKKPTSLGIPKMIWNLPSELMKIRLTGKFFDQYELDGIIKSVCLYNANYERPFDLKDIIYHPTNFSYTKGMGISKIPSLNYPISNIMASLKARNIIHTKKGMIGFISNEGKDSMGSPLPVKTGEKSKIEKSFDEERNLYGTGEKILITNSATRWNPTSFPVRDMMFHESDEMDFQTICGAFGMDRDIFPTVYGATFENKKQGLKNTYQNTIIPIADAYAEMMTEKLAPNQDKKKYILTYDWLPLMKEDELKEAQEEKLEVERLSVMLHDGVISHEAYAEAMGIKMTGTKQIQPKTQPNANNSNNSGNSGEA